MIQSDTGYLLEASVAQPNPLPDWVHPRGSSYRAGLWNQRNLADLWNQRDRLCGFVTHVNSTPTDIRFGSNQDLLMWVVRF
ncbi:hypothetical protein PGT21_036367 [Puccinia graminis f. sp. tritici]|uniref:Uncharacterized protein n=1 Tax=Puccinia graminis f. sp. tritici TaxID=56615 RepID=A0A5B0QRE5_PUCGR|nr:hypothetical protein PGT21_036367 [Puccinia graminis f. sp. tritici]